MVRIVQTAGIGEMRVDEPQLFRFCVHHLHKARMCAADLFRHRHHRVIRRCDADAFQQIFHAHRLTDFQIHLGSAHAGGSLTGRHHVAQLQRTGIQLFIDQQQAHHLRHGSRVQLLLGIFRIDLPSAARFHQIGAFRLIAQRFFADHRSGSARVHRQSQQQPENGKQEYAAFFYHVHRPH